MSEVGRVIAVEELLPSTLLVTDADVDDETLFVADVDLFSETGGVLEVAGVQYPYGPPDDDLETLPLLSPMTTSADEGDEVKVPAAVTRYASVVLDDAPDVPVLARIPHSLVGRLPAGVYDEDDLDAVTIREVTPGDWRVTDVLGRELARPGYSDTDWTNDHGIRLIAADLENGVAEMNFGSWEFVAENAGPVDANFPNGPDIRRIGTDDVGVGAIRLTFDFPAKVTVSAEASVLNDTGVDWNVRFYVVATDPDDPDFVSIGRQGTQWTTSGDKTAGRHRQVSRSRSLEMFEGTPDAPQSRNLWWGFRNDSGSSRAAEVRNMSMTIRVQYAPDMPTEEEPERSPAWTDDDATIESYLRTETDDDT